MDVASVRAEIKAWERDFRAKHGRDPSVQEIKDQPAIAAKYKLYKSLSKASSAASSSKSSAPPSTPPRSEPRQSQPASSSIIHKSRPVKVDPPVSTSNPFSPVKNRKKAQTDLTSPQRASHQSRTNPFATPSKSKAKPHAARRTPSPDPFPPIQALVMVHRTPTAPAPTSAVTRARKRLRGEPVSPSPVKEKRPRVASQAALSFPSHAALLDSPDASDGDDMAADPNDTIIADTPMKPRTGGRNFKVLFDDALPDDEKRPVKALSSRKKTSSSHNIFIGVKRERSRALTPSSDEEEDWSLKPRLRSLDATTAAPPKVPQNRPRVVNGKSGIPRALVPGKNDLWSDMGPPKAHSAGPSRTTSTSSFRPQNKRSLPDDHDDANHDDASATNTFLNLPLIPPSPPPPDASKPSGPKYSEKGKGKAAFSRKKAKLLQDAGTEENEDEEDSPEDEIQVREIDPLSQLPKADRDGGADSDWEAHWRAPPDPDDPAVLAASSVDPGKFEVNLPDELQRILAISPPRRKEVDEEKVARQVVYGRRETHYDPNKGGEIWDVGEDSENAAGTEEEWEGEPVPWEVGEL